MRGESLLESARDSAAVDHFRCGRRTGTRDCATTVRWSRGAIADELFVLCRPSDVASPVARQAAAVYQALVEVLSSEGIGPDALVSETVFFRRIAQDLDVVLDTRVAVLGEAGAGSRRASMTCIEQPPLSEGVHLELSAVALVPHQPRSCPASEVTRAGSCTCQACLPGTRAKIVRIGDQTCLYAGDIVGRGSGAVEQASDMFDAAEALLGEAGMSFGDVVRTWIYLRDIDRDYDSLNTARRDFFRRHGIERKPASTGVQGIAASSVHDFSMSLYAVKSPQPLLATVMSTKALNEAWTYGADFSRGLRVVDANNDTLYVSGTASIAEAGQTVHAGDFEAQGERMLHNIASLLAAQGSSFRDIASAIAYLKHPADAPALRAIFHKHGFDGFPVALVQAPLCRPELLCETEAIAILPRLRQQEQ